MISDLKVERNTAQSKALVMEQICEMMHKEEKQNYVEMSRKVSVSMSKLRQREEELETLKAEVDKR